MSKKSTICFRNLLMNFVFLIFSFQSYAQWTQPQFVIGTFWDPKMAGGQYWDTVNPALTVPDIARFQQAKDAYFNLCTGTGENTSLGWHGQGGMDYALYIASKVGIKYLVTDVGYFGCPAFNASTASSVVTFYKNSIRPNQRETLYGYHIKDEPTDAATDTVNVQAWLNYFKTNDNTKLTYMNLMPRYYYAAGAAGNTSYNKYLNTYLNDATEANKPDVVAFDSYPILTGNVYRTDYFYNLDTIRKKAGTRPFWCYPMSTQGAGYERPTAASLRFTDFCPLAYGAKGLIYFTFQTPDSGGPWQDGLIDVSGNKTALYDSVKIINNFISTLIGPMIMNSTSVGAYHKAITPTSEAIPTGGAITNCTTFLTTAGIAGVNLLAGVFKDKIDATKYHALIVNKSITAAAASSTVKLTGDYSTSIYISPSVVGYSGSTMFTAIAGAFATGVTTLTIPALAAGEGRLITTSVPKISATAKVNITCPSGSNGSITITAAGGTGTLQYSIDNGTTWQASNVFNGLVAGSYTVRTKDQNNFEFAYASNPIVLTEGAAPAQPSSITGSITPCPSTSQTFSVTNVGGITYTWSVPGNWTISSGQNTNSITTAVGTDSGTVSVTPSNSCVGTAQTLSITTKTPIPAQPSTISGSPSPFLSSSQTYSVTNISGVTYTWSVPADWSITNGQNTNSINTTVGTNNGPISVTPSNACGSGTARTLSIINLPIELISFTALCDDNTSYLSWKTASETNNALFQIQRSEDGINWHSIGSVNGAGNSNSILEYSFNDSEEIEGNKYYRIMQIDFDGAYTYSDVVFLNCTDVESIKLISVTNEQNDESVTLKFSASSDENYQFKLFDDIGQLVKLISGKTPTDGLIELRIDSQKLNKGYYLISMQNTKSSLSLKVLLK